MLNVALTITSLFPLSFTSKESRVETGIYTSIKQFPYSAFLLIELGERTYGCGASILNQNFVLTAAHCLTFVTDEDYVSITVGHEVYHKGKMYEISEFRMHEEHQAFKNDIAVARTSLPIVLGENVKRISLMKLPPQRKKGFVAGWGLVNDALTIPTEQLTFAEQRVWTHRKCLKVIKYLPYGSICAGELNGTQHAARGDSGSALVMITSQRLFIQLGVVSWMHQPEGLVSYTNVPHYYTWITEAVWDLYCHRERKGQV